MTISDHTVGTWREVVDQLTPAQIAELERLERAEPQTLSDMARQWAKQNTAATSAPPGQIAPPTGAVRAFDWQLDGRWFRDCEGTTRRAGPARVQIYGRQLADGSARWWIAVHSRHLGALDAAAARELAATLADAADEIEGLS